MRPLIFCFYNFFLLSLLLSESVERINFDSHLREKHDISIYY